MNPTLGHVISTIGCDTHALAALSFRAASHLGIFALLPVLTGEGLMRELDL
jgi:hypothetical protein